MKTLPAMMADFSRWNYYQTKTKGMQKTAAMGGPCMSRNPLATILRIMRMLSIFLFVCSMAVSARPAAQTVSLTAKNATLKEIFTTVKSQTGYRILYNEEVFGRFKPVAVSAASMPLSDFLSMVFKNQNLNFYIDGNNIFVSGKKVPAGTTDITASPAELPPPVTIRVTDSLGQPLLGVTVSLNKKIVGFTNADGIFSIDVKPGDVLQFTSVGLETISRKVGNANALTIVMRPSADQLTSVDVTVSTGYQNIPKERATGSFKVIDKEQLDKPATTIAQRLIGTTPGLVSRVDANGNTTFTIRGRSSLATDANPLIVLDGFPLENTSINDINPNNVQSVYVLKDAAAASIWGSRAANGVIVITTKSGKKGVPFSADINAFTRIGSKFDLDYVRNLATAAETVAFEKYAFNRWGSAYNAGSLDQINRPANLATAYLNEVRLGRMTQAQADAELARLASLDNRQQIRDHILDNPVSTQVNLNITASTSLVSNALSALFETNTTDFKGTDNRRAMLNYRAEANVSKWLDFNVNFMGQYQRANNNGFTAGDISGWSPYDMLLNPDGSRVQNFNAGYYMPSLALFVPQFGAKFPYDFYYNPLRERDARDFSTETMNFRVQAGLTGKIMPGLTISSRIMYDNNNGFTRNLSKEDAFTVRSAFNNSITWDRTLNGAITPNLPKGAQLAQSRSKFRGYNFRNQLDFNRVFANDHAVNFVAGTEIRNFTTETFTPPIAYGYNDETLAVGNFPNGPGGSFRQLPNWIGGNSTFGYLNSFTYTTNRYYSVFSNLAYTYKGKYTVSGSYRTDAANFIAANDESRYSPFWSVGGLWQLGREEFMAPVSIVDKLALRLTYGVNGNEDRSTSPYPLINTGSANSQTGAIAATVSSYGNPLLRWERTYMLNAGIDFSLWKGKLYGTVEYYQKNGRDLLADISISAVNGVTSQKLNNVEMYNRGIDLELGSSLQINKNIRWSGNVNFSYNNSKITRLFRTGWTSDQLVRGGSGAFVEGYNASTIWSYRYAGIQNGQPSLYGPKNEPFFVGTFIGGDARSWMDAGGVTVAPYTLGMNHSFDIHGFTLSAIVIGKFGHVFRRSGFNYPWIFNDKRPVNARFSEVFNGDPNKILPLPAQTATSTTYSVWNNHAPFLDYLVENAGHVRLQEVSLAYTLNPQWMKKTGFSNLRLYAQGNDLRTFTNNTYNEDPEFQFGTVKPRPRFTFGFKVQL